MGIRLPTDRLAAIYQHQVSFSELRLHLAVAQKTENRGVRQSGLHLLGEWQAAAIAFLRKLMPRTDRFQDDRNSRIAVHVAPQISHAQPEFQQNPI
jgi:hypothetical protein